MFNNIITRLVTKMLILFFPLAVVQVCFLGCDSNVRQVETVTGQVTFNGKPLADAQVSFYPKNPDGFVAVGTSLADGKFTLVTPGTTKPGAVRGEYYVTVTKIIGLDDNGNPLTPETTPEDIRKGIRIPKRVSAIPEKYGQSEKALLEATVVRGKNSFLFKLDDKP
ncbi:MAG: DUF4198 domain-containing protein [Planctomycetaceae bacterium]|jgi:hypothetical protein|nr:DUF4198 domain-containing protein [Planctomycetaceae bacterium]